MNVESLYRQLPDGMQETTKRWYHFVHPRKSWFELRKMERTDEAFVDRFFDSSAEYERYVEEFSTGSIYELCEGAEASLSDEYTIYDAHRDACLKCYALIRKREPETVVETGVYHGVSTLTMLLALDRNDAGRLYSIDYARYLEKDGLGHFERGRPSCADTGSVALPDGMEPGWIVPEDLRDRWHLTEGKSQRKLPALLSSLATVDFFLHNSEHSASCMLFEFELVWEWLAEGALMVSSHVDHNDAFETFANERDCDHGLLDFEPAFEDYDQACSSGYIIKTR